MKSHFFICFFILLSSIASFSQNKTSPKNKYTISGYVKDNATGEYMIGANVYIKELLKGTTTNVYGFYSLTVEEGEYTLAVSFIGFEEDSVKISLTKDIVHNSTLSPKVIMTKEVVISAEREDKNVNNAQMGAVSMDIEQVKSLPAFMGEVDILKTIQLLPGIQAAGEGNSGFYVRGGGPDQNLILLDEAVVYNAAHLFGFFSVFNADAIKNIEVIKGGMPANYGGRLASVLDITMKEGNAKEYKVDGAIGAISSKLTLQGPIKKDTGSFIISGRRTYTELWMPLIFKASPEAADFEGTGYYFYDLNAKINYRISDKDRFFMSGYFGRDVFKFSRGQFKVRIPWGNSTASLRWNHLFSKKLFLNTSLIYNDYNFSFEAQQDEFKLKLFSGVRDYNLKLDFNYFPSVRHNIKYGVNYIYHTFTPSSASASQGETIFNTGESIKQYAHESAVFINDEFDWTDRLSVNGGLRISLFNHVGPFKRFEKNDIGATTDSIIYSGGEVIKTYSGVEPRLTFRYTLDSKSSVKAAFTRNFQYIHLASLSGVSLPTDVWVPSSDKVKPQIGNQYAAGYFRNFYENKYEGSVEVYYKTMENLVEYKEGALPGDNINDNSDNHLTFGTGDSYGAEFFLKKRTGQFNGWIGYTWSKTFRTFPEINQGKTFPAKYDRRHDLSIVGTYEINEKWSVSATFVYATGNAITLPVARYMIEGNIVNEYGERNSFRMAPYHRADISVNMKGKKRKRYQSNWNLSVYNIYNRANPYFIYFSNEGNIYSGNLEIKAKQVSLFSILPTITWSFSF